MAEAADAGDPPTAIRITDDSKSHVLEFASRDERHLSSSMVSLAMQDDHFAFTPPVSPTSGTSSIKPGSYRYLKGADLDGMVYDFAIVTHRPKLDVKKQQQAHTFPDSPEKDGGQGLIIEKLVENGLDVDVIEGDFSRMVRHGGTWKTGGSSKYFVLLIHGNDDVLATYGRRMKFQTWLRSGNTREVESVVRVDPIVAPAERIQIIDHIIREGAKITSAHPCVHSIFPVHDEKTNEFLLKTYIQSRKLESMSESFFSNVKTHFGEKVAYYFAFMDFYNKSLIPIAGLGFVLTCFRGIMGTAMYMRVLVFWALLVSVGWSFWFLKQWSRRNNELNYLWKNNLETKSIVYRNPAFRGESFINPVTGLPDQSYPSWKRYPKYLLIVLFMMLQISIMMLIIACWITVFEIIKVRYPNAGIFSAQWFYILGGGICYGLFVDIFQWNLIVTKAAKYFTEWENWKTIEQFEKSMVRKLFLMDFLNYYTWFFLLAFVYVIPGAGDAITNFLNSVLWKDPSNCCFGPYLNASGDGCASCPAPWHQSTALMESVSHCVPCRGWVTFDIHHLDLEKLFLTPIIVTQGLNMLIAVMIPWIHRQHHQQTLRVTDRKAMEIVKAQGPRQLIAEMAYRVDDNETQLTNMSKARFLENDEEQMEKLNAKARAILFQSEQENYDPYDDYHHVTVQFGFVVMFSMLWPLMPLACMLINALKMRGDGFRLCKTMKRPFPRKAGGIGEWNTVLFVLACTGVIVNVGLVFISTGAMEFFSHSCVKRITKALHGNLSAFMFGPEFVCYSLTVRMVMILVCEHIAFAAIWIFWKVVKSVPPTLELEMVRQEYEFKSRLYRKATKKQRSSSRSMSRARLTTPPSADRTTETTLTNDRRASTTPVHTPPSAMLQPSAQRRTSKTKKAHGTKDEREPLLSSKSLAKAWESVKSTSSSDGPQ